VTWISRDSLTALDKITCLSAILGPILIGATNPSGKECGMHGVSREEIAGLVSVVDYSDALDITASEADVRNACRIARLYGFRAVVAFPQFLGILVDELDGTGVRAQIPVGFPSGGVTTLVKCTEAEEGLKRGASDVDMVMNIAAFKQGDYARVSKDIASVMKVAEPYKVPFKVIIEIGVLTDEEKATAARLVKDSGADFIKTCTGFGPGRVTLHDITLIRETVGRQPGIKASGGVAAIEDGVAFMKAGANIVAMRRFLVEQLENLQWPKKSA
jgi:deoxyribose-phosphate aldolase